MSKITQHGQQLQFSKRENEEESLKFLQIFSKHYPNIDKDYRLFWRTVYEECQNENIFPETTLVKLYSEVWPNFLVKARNNFHSNGLTKVDQIVMDISKTRNPHWWGPPVASKNARARAVAAFNPPKVKIIDPQNVATPGRGRKRKNAVTPVTPAAPVAAKAAKSTLATPAAADAPLAAKAAKSTPVPSAAKITKSRKKSDVNIDYKTPLTSKPQRQTRRRKDKQQQEQLPSIADAPSPSDIPRPSGFKVPALPTPSSALPTTLSTIAALIRSLSSAQQSNAASTTTTAAATSSSQLSSSAALLSIPPTIQSFFQFPKPPHPTPATPATRDTIQPIFNFDFLPPSPPPPPFMAMMDIEPHPTIDSCPNTDTAAFDAETTKDVNENYNPLKESTSFHLKLSSDEDEY